MEIINNKSTEEEIAERERYNQAYDLISMTVTFSCDPRKPGEFIRRYGHYLSRLHELKAHHFNLSKFKI